MGLAVSVRHENGHDEPGESAQVFGHITPAPDWTSVPQSKNASRSKLLRVFGQNNMPRRVKRNRVVAFAMIATLLLTGCAGTAVINKPLAPGALANDNGAISHGGYHLLEVPGSDAPSVLVLLAFSGGGKRSAAFGYGVLKGMREFPLTIAGHQTTFSNRSI